MSPQQESNATSRACQDTTVDPQRGAPSFPIGLLRTESLHQVRLGQLGGHVAVHVAGNIGAVATSSLQDWRQLHAVIFAERKPQSIILFRRIFDCRTHSREPQNHERSGSLGVTVNDRPTGLAAATRHHDATSVIPTLSQRGFPRLRLQVCQGVVTRI